MGIEPPSALIFGSNNFVAKRLAVLLMSRGISVLLDDEVVGKPLYFFDFGGGEYRYDEMVEKKVKICKVESNYELRITNYELNKYSDIRQVNLYSVYGLGMNTDWFLGQAVELAARNKNLVLPKLGEKFRLLCVDDAVEAVMRAVILSGTVGKVFEVVGKEIDSKEVASALIDLAKMTKMEVKENYELPASPAGRRITNYELEKESESSAKALRWKPEVDFRQGIAPVVAEFVAKVDDEARQGKKQLKITNYELRIKNQEKEPRVGMKVEVEENSLQSSIINPQLGEEQDKKEEKSNWKLVTGNKIDDKQEEEEEEKIIEDETENVVVNEKKPEIHIEPELEVKIREREIFVREDEVEEDETVGKKVEWGKVEPIENNYKLRITNYELPEEKKIIELKPVVKKVSKPANIPWKPILWVGLGLVLTVVAVLAWFVGGTIDMAMNLKKPIKLLEERRIDEAKKMVEKYQVRNKNMAWFWQDTQIGEIIKISGETLDVEAKLCDLADSMEKINGAIFEDKVIDFKSELTVVGSNLQEIETQVGIIQARLLGVRKWIPGRWRSDVDKATDMISKNVDLISKLRQATSVLPEVLGLDGKRRDYLVLLQNEMELRATGGFIGSYGILSFEGGRLLSFDVKDIYDADGQLKGHVEPPEEIKRYLGEAAWFMRDANWKASFPLAAKDIQWFFEKEVGRSVDGVIGIDLAVVKSILAATGEIYVPDFKENVNKDNLYEQAEFYSESKFFPGSVQKASFLGGIGKQLFDEVSKLPTVKRWNLVMGLADVLERNDLQVVLNNSTAAQVMTDLGWDGEIFVGKCTLGQACYADYLYVVESNLGVNKANYFLYRSMEQKIDIREAAVERTLRINYENLAKDTNWPGGDYKNYVRIYLPKDVQVSDVTITTGGTKQVVALDEVKMVNLYDKRELGFLVLVPITKKVVVEVKYASKFDQMKDKFSYISYIQRQPGFGDTGLVNLVSLPNGWQAMQVSPEASVVGGKLLFNQKLDRDMRMGVEIAK